MTKFRRRFRLPYDQYVELLNELETSDHFKRWRKGNTDRCGKEASPLSLLLLGALRYLGRGWTFDDIEEATAISEETHRQFFHTFIHYGSTVLFDKYVLTPATKDDADIHIFEFDLAGFPGCVSSTDATHIAMDCCAHKLRHVHTGFKLNLPSRTYNLSCNHRRRILFTTSGHPASWNDKTLQRFDNFMTGIYSGKLLNDVTFELYDKNEKGETIKVQYKGAWQLVDNGYINWSTAIPPSKNATNYDDVRWSKWVESMRKDVECTFGILKTRWRILRSPIRMKSIDDVDRVWKTCCALHNWLLEIDGGDMKYGGDAQYGSGSFSELTEEDIPVPVQRLNLDELNRLDYSGVGVGSDMINNGDEDNDGDQQLHGGASVNILGTNIVRKLSQATFRDKLIQHFDIKFKSQDVRWPRSMKKRTKKKRRTI